MHTQRAPRHSVFSTVVFGQQALVCKRAPGQGAVLWLAQHAAPGPARALVRWRLPGAGVQHVCVTRSDGIGCTQLALQLCQALGGGGYGATQLSQQCSEGGRVAAGGGGGAQHRGLACGVGRSGRRVWPAPGCLGARCKVLWGLETAQQRLQSAVEAAGAAPRPAVSPGTAGRSVAFRSTVPQIQHTLFHCPPGHPKVLGLIDLSLHRSPLSADASPCYQHALLTQWNGLHGPAER